MPFGIATQHQPVQGCFMCPDNYQLAFEPMTAPGLSGYVIPGSMPLQIEVNGTRTTVLVPFPFTALVVPYAHPLADNSGGYGYTFPDYWPATLRQLLRLVPDLNAGDPWSGVHQIGHASGARVPTAITDAGLPAHPWEWIVYGRAMLPEIDETTGVGLATILHRSRQTADGLPSDRGLYELWLEVQSEDDPQAAYHQRLLERLR
jgi:hypothetical protein